MDIKWSVRFTKEWRRIVVYTLDNYGRRQASKNADRLERLLHILAENPKYGFPEPLLKGVSKHDYRSLLFFGPYKIVYYVSSTHIHLVDIWNMKMSPERLSKPYNTTK